MDLTKVRQVASMLAGVLLGGLHSLVSARVSLCWLCMRFRTVRVASCHGRDTLTFNQIGRDIPTFADAAGVADLIMHSDVEYSRILPSFVGQCYLLCTR